MDSFCFYIFKCVCPGDFGFVIAKDSFRLFGTNNPVDLESNGGLNLDFFMPIGYSFTDDFRIVITPRYSFNGVFVRLNKHETKAKFYTPMLFGVSAGVWYKRLYMEYSTLYYRNITIPSFGIAYVFSSKNESKEIIYYY
ncbi:MAG: hypothetical protein PF517_01230 [Salinivirgaceae bacterium]|nr:hypothetical protein [Salinivirgaceae bacterium]